MKQTIAVDIDYVLLNSTKLLRNVVNTRYDLKLTRGYYQVKGEYELYYEPVWHMHKCNDMVSRADLNMAVIAYQLHMPPHKNVQSVLPTLSKIYELVINTAWNLTWESATHLGVTQICSGIFR